MSMKTPLARISGLGSAKSGTNHFWNQRLTAAANVPLSIFVVWFVMTHATADQAAIAATLANPLCATAMVLALVSLTWHMRLGLQVVIEDYVHTERVKLPLVILNTFFSLAVAAAGIISVLLLAFGG